MNVIQHFGYRERITTQADKTRLEQAVTTATKQLALFEEAVSATCQQLYQRKAQVGYIIANHTAWAENLKASFRLFQTALNGVKADAQYIPELERTALALESLSLLEVSSHPTIKIYDELITVLTSVHHQDALNTYKVKKRECRTLIKTASRDVRLNSLTKLFQDVVALIDKAVPQLDGKPVIEKHETILLYLETLQYIKYSANQKEPVTSSWWSWLSWSSTPAAQAVPDQELTARIAALVSSIVEKEQALAACIPLNVARAEDQQPELVTQYLESCPVGDPPDEYNFRRNNFRYREIQPQVDALKGIAKGLFRLNNSIKRQITLLYSGKETIDQHFYNTLLDGFHTRIHTQLDALLGLPQTERVHAGRYYVALLSAKVRHVRIVYDHFKSVSSCKPCIAALNRTFSYLASPHEPQKLALAIEAASKFAKPVAETNFRNRLRTLLHDVLYDILAKHGRISVRFTEQELEIPKKILARAPLKDFREPDEAGGMPAAILRYLTKGFINKLYFLGDALDHYFEITVTILMHDERYREITHTLLAEWDLFFRYMSVSNATVDTKLLLMMGDLLDTLSRSSDGLGTLNRYCHAQKILHDLKRESETAQQKLRLDWIVAETKPEIERLKDADGYPDALEKLDEPENILYKQLVEEVQLPNIPANMPKERILKTLIYRWALKRLMKDDLLDESTLHCLFTEYLTVEAFQKIYRDHYGLCFMELALHKCTESVDGRLPQLYTQLSSKRGLADYNLWKDILKIYDEFRKAKRDARAPLLERVEDELRRYEQNALTPYVALSRDLYKEMQTLR